MAKVAPETLEKMGPGYVMAIVRPPRYRYHDGFRPFMDRTGWMNEPPRAGFTSGVLCLLPKLLLSAPLGQRFAFRMYW